jgi:hypothetical protein
VLRQVHAFGRAATRLCCVGRVNTYALFGRLGLLALIAVAWPTVAIGAEREVAVSGIPLDLLLFVLTLLGVALFHHHTLAVALRGLASIVLCNIAFTGFKTGPGVAGLAWNPQERDRAQQPLTSSCPFAAGVESK